MILSIDYRLAAILQSLRITDHDDRLLFPVVINTLPQYNGHTYADIAYDERKTHSYLESLPWGNRIIFGLCSERSPPLVSSFTVELVKSIECI